MQGYNHLILSWGWRWSFVAALLIALGPQALGQAAGPTEYQVKAEFLFHFTQFIEWPISSFTSEGSPLQLCVMEPDPFGSLLEDTLNGESIGGHSLVVTRNPPMNKIDHCHLLFISKQHASLRSTLQAALAQPTVLTVGEHEEFLKEGGMIQFYLDDQKIRFAINPQAIKQTELRMSAKLLRLAKIVNP